MARYATRRVGRQVRRDVTRHTKSGGAANASPEEAPSGGLETFLSCCLLIPFAIAFVIIMILVLSALGC
jgi:hypothetical protein